MINKVELSGTMFYDTQVQKFANGNELVKGTIVHNASFTRSDGSVKDQSSWFNLEFVGEAGNKARGLKKGQNIELFGVLEQQKWEDKETKAKRSTVIIKVLSFKEVLKTSNLNTADKKPVGNVKQTSKQPINEPEEIENIPF